MRKLLAIFLLLLLLSPNYLIAEEKGMSKEALKIFSEFESDYQKSRTELIKAAEDGNVTKVKALLDKRVDPDESDLLGTTPLIIASGKGHLDIVLLLLKSGAYVDAADKNGLTPLMYAVPHPKIVKVLLQMGASVSLENKMGETALDRAKNEFYGTPNDETFQLLQKAKEEEDKAFKEMDELLEEALSE